jgi:hypothetical protein
MPKPNFVRERSLQPLQAVTVILLSAHLLGCEDVRSAPPPVAAPHVSTLGLVENGRLLVEYQMPPQLILWPNDRHLPYRVILPPEARLSSAAAECMRTSIEDAFTRIVRLTGLRFHRDDNSATPAVLIAIHNTDAYLRFVERIEPNNHFLAMQPTDVYFHYQIYADSGRQSYTHFGVMAVTDETQALFDRSMTMGNAELRSICRRFSDTMYSWLVGESLPPRLWWTSKLSNVAVRETTLAALHQYQRDTKASSRRQDPPFPVWLVQRASAK